MDILWWEREREMHGRHLLENPCHISSLLPAQDQGNTSLIFLVRALAEIDSLFQEKDLIITPPSLNIHSQDMYTVMRQKISSYMLSRCLFLNGRGCYVFEVFYFFLSS